MSNKFEYSPGPWGIATASVIIESPIGERYMAVGNANGSICRVTRMARLEKTDLGNAALIAAAPAMYEVLQKILSSGAINELPDDVADAVEDAISEVDDNVYQDVATALLFLNTKLPRERPGKEDQA